MRSTVTVFLKTINYKSFKTTQKMKNISSTQQINVQRKTFNEKNEPIYRIYTVKINGDVPASHRMVQTELNAILVSEELTRIKAIQKKEAAIAAKKKAAKEKQQKMLAEKENPSKEGKSTNPAKRKKFYHKNKVNKYVRHQ